MFGGSRHRGGFRHHFSNSFSNKLRYFGLTNLAIGSTAPNLVLSPNMRLNQHLNGQNLHQVLTEHDDHDHRYGISVTTSSRLRSTSGAVGYHQSRSARKLRSRRQLVLKTLLATGLFAWIVWLVSLFTNNTRNGAQSTRMTGFTPQINGMNTDLNNGRSGFMSLNDIRREEALQERKLAESKDQPEGGDNSNLDGDLLEFEDQGSEGKPLGTNGVGKVYKGDMSLWIGVHQNVDVNIIDFEFPVPKVCAGRLFYATRLNIETARIDVTAGSDPDNLDLPWFLSDEESELNIETDKGDVDACCSFCSLTSGCTAFKFDKGSCVLYSVGGENEPGEDIDIENDESDVDSSIEVTNDLAQKISSEVVFNSAELEIPSTIENVEQAKLQEDVDPANDLLSRLRDFEATFEQTNKIFGDNEENDEVGEERDIEDNSEEDIFTEEESDINTEKTEETTASLDDNSDKVLEKSSSKFDLSNDVKGEADEKSPSKVGHASVSEVQSVGQKQAASFEDFNFADWKTDSILSELDQQENDLIRNNNLDISLLHRDDGNGDEDYDDADKLDVQTRNIYEEHLLSQKVNTNTAQQPLDELLPSGDYRRLISDPFYADKFKFFYRFRTIKEFTELETAIMLHFNRIESIEPNTSVETTALKRRLRQKKVEEHLQVKYITYGRSGDKHAVKPLKALQFGNPSRGKHVFILAGIRGCEWVPSLAVLHTALTLMSRDGPTRKVLDSVRFHVISMANPDGYEYSRRKSPSSAKHWCKNRRLLHNTHGVDLSKNFGLDPDYLPSTSSKSKKTSKLDVTDLYNFSETESLGLSNYIKHFVTGKGRGALLNVRCCGGSVTPPRMYTKGVEEKINVDAIATLLTHLITSNTGSKYAINHRQENPLFNKKYAGNIIDWAHSTLGIDHAYEVDLKASGLTTRTNHNLISEEPFIQLSRDLERAVVVMAQLLLAQPVEGPPTESNFKLVG